jgi:type III pantothenate kinase
MTIDLLLPDNTYKGGNISPGLNMRLQAMHSMTGRLPLVSGENALIELGNDTHSAIANGALSGMYHEIESYITNYLEMYSDLQIVFCGGDHSRFDLNGKYRIFAAPEFVLLGLYHLLLLNEN